MAEKLCYNKGCAKNFKPEENNQESCRFHPGIPVFHDAYKGWSCCNKKTTDFTEFLNIKGCTVGPHNPEKPVEVPKPQKDVPVVPEPVPELRKPTNSQPRPSENSKMFKLPFTVGASLKPVLAKLEEAGDIKKEINVDVGRVPFGTQCKHSGCKTTYQGEETNSSTCLYHSGAPIFHEGMKFWSCCQKKTSDFNTFLDQEGCTTGSHIWFKQVVQENTVACRYDWHQTGSQVVISVFAKASFPEKSTVHLNPVKCKIHIVFGEDRSVFDSTLILGGIVDVGASSVEYLGSKVEIKMKKAEPVSWRQLALPQTEVKEVADDMSNVNLDDVEVLVDHAANEDVKKKFFAAQQQ